MAKSRPLIALIGIDAEDKNRAAKFLPSQLEEVQRAGELMKLGVAIPKTPEAEKLVSKLPFGKLFANGKAMVPLYKGGYDELLTAFIPLEPNTVAEKNATSNEVRPTLWGDLKKGSIVIAPEFAPHENGFWKAEIVGISPDRQRVTVKWLDNLRQAPTTMDVEQVAILHPKFA